MHTIVTARRDLLYGRNGNDSLFGGAGNDRLDGGRGDDWIFGGDGNDRLLGGLGNDALFGGAGNDRIIDHGNASLIYGGLGDDVIFGGGFILGDESEDEWRLGGNDTVTGGNGSDEIWGGGGDDLIYGRGGGDAIYGGGEADTVYGGLGNDAVYGFAVYGGSGTDSVHVNDGGGLGDGGAGNDEIHTRGNWSEVLSGGIGDDLFVFVVDYPYLPSGDDLITDFAPGQDALRITVSTPDWTGYVSPPADADGIWQDGDLGVSLTAAGLRLDLAALYGVADGSTITLAGVTRLDLGVDVLV